MSVDRLEAYTRHVKIFTEWIGAETPVAEISEAKLHEWWTVLGLRVAEGLSPSYAKTIFMTSRQFLRYLIDLRVIPPLTNIASKQHSFNDTARQVEIFR